jgi:hypothetical protein
MAEGVIARPIEPSEREPFDDLTAAEHYLRNAEVVEGQLRYVTEYSTWAQFAGDPQGARTRSGAQLSALHGGVGAQALVL